MPVSSVFCFRRDLRVHDNLGLADMCGHQKAATVLPVFCLDPRQVSPQQNGYRSDPAIRFMFESLVDLDTQIRKHSPTNSGLVLLYGEPEKVLPELAKQLVRWNNGTQKKAPNKPVCPLTVGWNSDVTPFSVHRDAAIQTKLETIGKDGSGGGGGVHVRTNDDDVTVVPVHNIRTQDGRVYKVFTPFLRNARAKGVRAPIKLPKACQFVSLPTPLLESSVAKQVVPVDKLFCDRRFPCPSHPITPISGGRTEGLKRLAVPYLQRRCSVYTSERDNPWEEKTTRLSAYLKFGCVSFREAHSAIERALATHPKSAEALTRELFWNAFYAYVTLHFPHVLAGQSKTKTKTGQKQRTSHHPRNMEMHPRLHHKVDALWRPANAATTAALFQKWTDGQTGMPFVDAAMRQLKQTGWMHNRARMIVASYLTKNLRIDWRMGELHFARHLVDYDPSSNSGGWQWAAGTGVDTQLRIFNPWIQMERYDKEAVYIKQYVPELQKVEPRHIHKWQKPSIRALYADDKAASSYPAEIIDCFQSRKDTLAAWKQI
jgi:deoxyribodipyrimidine photo-lyase